MVEAAVSVAARTASSAVSPPRARANAASSRAGSEAISAWASNMPASSALPAALRLPASDSS